MTADDAPAGSAAENTPAAVSLPAPRSWPVPAPLDRLAAVAAVLVLARYPGGDRLAILAALVAPLGAAAMLLPFPASWSNTNVALLLVVVVAGVAAIGSRVAGAVAAVCAAAWFDFFCTLPYYRFTIRGSADATTAVLLLATGLAVLQLAGQEIELRIFGNGQYCGRFMLKPRPGSRPFLQARLVAVTLADRPGAGSRPARPPRPPWQRADEPAGRLQASWS